LMGKGLGFFHQSKLQTVALNRSIEISVEHSTHFFQHYNLSISYDVGQLPDSLSKFNACVANTQFPPPSKQLTPPWSCNHRNSMFRLQAVLPQKHCQIWSTMVARHISWEKSGNILPRQNTNWSKLLSWYGCLHTKAHSTSNFVYYGI
jgi:hypothetical protein